MVSTLSKFSKGDQVVRKGELCTVMKVDYSMDPVSYTVKVNSDGRMVGTEESYLAWPMEVEEEEEEASQEASPVPSISDSEEDSGETSCHEEEPEFESQEYEPEGGEEEDSVEEEDLEEQLRRQRAIAHQKRLLQQERQRQQRRQPGRSGFRQQHPFFGQPSRQRAAHQQRFAPAESRHVRQQPRYVRRQQPRYVRRDPFESFFAPQPVFGRSLFAF